MLDINYDDMDIAAYLEAQVDMKVKVPVAIEGFFNLTYEDDTHNTLENTTIKVVKY